MNEVTDLGRGAAVFIPTTEAAEEVFGERFMETMSTTARDVPIRYGLPPGFSIDRFSGEELSTDPKEVQPQHMAPNDAVVLYQRMSSCADEVDLDPSIAVTYLDGVPFQARAVTTSASLRDLLATDHAQLDKGAAIYAIAETLKHLQGGDAVIAKGEARGAVDTTLQSNPGDGVLVQIRLGQDALGQ